ncbi:MAG: MazG nucleotide pyrophosphohydrolase domain-containing protein, partial [Terracidiphilus sp.]
MREGAVSSIDRILRGPSPAAWRECPGAVIAQPGGTALLQPEVNWSYMDLLPDSLDVQASAPHGSTDPVDPAALFEQSVAIMARLRAPGGCPWDREQNFDSIRKYTLEETYEVFDAIERRDWPHLAEELGDLLLQVLFYAEMAANEGHFTIADVLGGLNRKLVRRHPHVFGEEASRAAGNRAAVAGADSAASVLRNWKE